jgi:hypothetical protein
MEEPERHDEPEPDELDAIAEEPDGSLEDLYLYAQPDDPERVPSAWEE